MALQCPQCRVDNPASVEICNGCGQAIGGEESSQQKIKAAWERAKKREMISTEAKTAAPLRVVTLKCESCSSSLDISPSTNSFACGYCGATQIVERSGGAISLKVVTNAIKEVQTGTDKTAAELALKRLEKDYVKAQNRLSEFEQNGKTRLSDINQQWIVLGIMIPIVLTVLVGSVINSAVALVPISVISVIVIVCCFYLCMQQREAMKIKLISERKEFQNQLQNIQDRINRNRMIVDG